MRPKVLEVADGSYIEHLGEKTFTAFSHGGAEHHMTAQVTSVNKALLSVSKLAGKGCRTVFEKGNSYIENTTTGDWIPLEERHGMYFIKMWIGKEQKRPV